MVNQYRNLAAGRRYFSTVNARGPEPHCEVIDIVSDGASRPVRVRIDAGSHAILLAPGGKPLWKPGRGSSADRVGTGPVPRLSLSCVQRGYRQSAGGTADIEVVYLEPVTCLPRRERQ